MIIMSEKQIKQYYERIETLLNGGSKDTYGFAPEEIRQILKWGEYFKKLSKEQSLILIDYQQMEYKRVLYKSVIDEVRKHNEQIIKDTKDFYRPTKDIIYSGDTLIELAKINISILDKAKESE